MASETPKNKVLSFLQQLCPRCRTGKIFATSTKINKSCPDCGLVWEREEGYFVGAMYFSYFLAVLFLCTFMVIWRFILPAIDLGNIALISIACFAPFVPLVFRYSRVIWIYFDRWAWPEKWENPEEEQ